MTISTSQSLSDVFYTQYLRFWEQCLREIFSCQPCESINNDVSFHGY